jgi:general secretion pathway protein L
MSTLLGIDIGTTAVKVAAIRTAYRKVQLVGLANVEIAQAGGVVEAVAQAARAATGDRGLGDSLAVSLEGQRGTTKIVGLPAAAAKQVASVLPFELEAQLPFDIEEAVFDFRVLPGVRDTKGEEVAVLVGVAKTVDVIARIDLIKTALSAEPERVGLGAFPIANLGPYVPALVEGIVAIVDVGTVSSDVLMLDAGEPVFARTITLGTKGLPGTAPKLARELRTTFAAYRASGGEAPLRMFVCGGGAFVSGAIAFLSDALALPVELLPAPAIETPIPMPEHVPSMARFAKAIGLALGLGPRSMGLNLRQGKLAFERGFAWVKDKIPLLAGLAAVIVVSFLFSAWAQLYAKSKEKVVFENALSLVTKDVLHEETSSAIRANELLAAQTGSNDEDPLPHADSFDVMVRISELIPSSMVHDVRELDIQKQHVVLHGVVGTIPDAEAIKTAVAGDRCFSDVKITRTNAEVGGTSQVYVLEFDIKCPEDVKGGAKKAAATTAPSSSASSGAGK